MTPPPTNDDGDDARAFAEVLAAAFDATDAEVQVVARQARDLHDVGRYRADTSRELTPTVVADNLADARDEGLASKWNWWIASLELAYGDYAEFQIRALERE